MTIEEQKKIFLSIRNYEEFDKRRNEFAGLNAKDPELREHLKVIFGEKNFYMGQLNTITDNDDECVIRTGIPDGMTRKEYIEFLRKKKKEYEKR